MHDAYTVLEAITGSELDVSLEIIYCASSLRIQYCLAIVAFEERSQHTMSISSHPDINKHFNEKELFSKP
jgi:hypothetical protein